jgi:hypothetical protein
MASAEHDLWNHWYRWREDDEEWTLERLKCGDKRLTAAQVKVQYRVLRIIVLRAEQLIKSGEEEKKTGRAIVEAIRRYLHHRKQFTVNVRGHINNGMPPLGKERNARDQSS